MLQGIDVSKWQGAIDWAKVAADPQDIKFAFVKCTEGGHIMETPGSVGYVDRRFEENFRGAKDHGIARGPYHFARVSHLTGTGKYRLLDDAESEASWFSQLLQRPEIGYDKSVDLPPVLDIEWGGAEGISGSDVVAWCLAFLKHLELRMYVQPLIYCGPNFFKFKMLSNEQFHKYGLWAVDPNRPPGNPKSFGQWQWLFHQYTFEGRVEGIDANVDCNVFRGSEEQLRGLPLSLPRLPPVGFDDPASSDWRPPCELPLPTLDLRSGSAYDQPAKLLQALLLAHGLGPHGLLNSGGVPDGKAGPKTAQLVSDFQRSVGLKSDKIVGQKTWWALISSGIPTVVGRDWAPGAPLGLPVVSAVTCSFDVNYNHQHSDVFARIQALLLAHGGTQLPSGQCGARFLQSLYDFQASVGLRSDGIVGPRTWSALLFKGIDDGTDLRDLMHGTTTKP